jgi:RNA polymerase sigma factor (sigma-70 family)
MLASLSDAELVHAARSGDRLASGVLFDRHRGLALGICRRMLRRIDLIEDAVQEAALQALLSLDHLRQPERFGAWFGGITLRVCHHAVRRHQTPEWSLDELAGGRAAPANCDPSAWVLEHELFDRVRTALAELPPGQRAAAALVYLGGFTHGEVADMLGIRTGAVKARMYKARGHLRYQLKTLWEDTLAQQPSDSSSAGVVDARVADVRRDADGHSWVVVREAGGLRQALIPTSDPGSASLARALVVALQRQRLPDWVFDEVVRERGETALVRPAPRTPARLIDGALRGVRLIGRDGEFGAILDVTLEAGESPEVIEEPVHALLRSVVTGAPLRIEERLLLGSSTLGPDTVGAATLADEVFARWERWRDQGPEWILMRVADVFVINPNTDHMRHVVMLQDQTDTRRFLPIWVGPSEGAGLAVLLAEAEMPRPLSIVMMGRLLSAAGGQVREVHINRLVDQTYFAELVVVGPKGDQTLDARPSDALGVALHMRAPVLVAANVLELAAEYDIKLPEPSAAMRICDAMREKWDRPRWLKAAV